MVKIIQNHCFCAFINVEISFLQIVSKYSLQLIKWGIFHSTGSDKAIVLTGPRGRTLLMNTLRNFARSAFADIVAKFEYFVSNYRFKISRQRASK